MLSRYITMALLMGYASHYSPDIMYEVITNRQLRSEIPLVLPLVDGYVASPYCKDIGNIWYLRPKGGNRWETFLVVDCADVTKSTGGVNDQEWMLKHNILVEVDYDTAVRWSTVGEWLQIERKVHVPLDYIHQPWRLN